MSHSAHTRFRDLGPRTSDRGQRTEDKVAMVRVELYHPAPTLLTTVVWAPRSGHLGCADAGDVLPEV